MTILAAIVGILCLLFGAAVPILAFIPTYGGSQGSVTGPLVTGAVLVLGGIGLISWAVLA